jgi:capsular exopolysaccharide synthesis family protein
MIEYLRNKPTSAMAEAIRNLRTSVTLANPKNPPQLIMITSSIPGEGKTTVAVSLALNLAGLGKRVLLIDGDIRRNTLSQYFHSESGVEQHNIVNILEGDTNISDAVLRLPETGIDVLMSEKSDTNAADIFASEAFGRFVGDLRDRYDHIVFDTPPVSGPRRKGGSALCRCGAVHRRLEQGTPRTGSRRDTRASIARHHSDRGCSEPDRRQEDGALWLRLRRLLEIRVPQVRAGLLRQLSYCARRSRYLP